MKENVDRIYSFSLIKGAGCFVVAANHYFNLYPVPCAGMLQYLYRWITNGSYMVYVFLAVSYFFSSLKVYKNEKLNIGREALRRYLNLVPFVMIMYVVVYLMNRFRAFDGLEYALEISGGSDPAIDYSKISTLYSMCKKALTETLIRHTSDYIFPFWMLHMILVGGVISQLFSGIFAVCNPFGKIFASVIFTLMMWKINIYYVLCSLASIIAYFYYRQVRLSSVFSFIFACGAIFVGFHYGQTVNDWIIYISGAIAAVASAANSPAVHNIYYNNIAAALEKISFPVYLIHQPVTTSFCAMLFIKLRLITLNPFLINFFMICSYFGLIIILAFVGVRILEYIKRAVVYEKYFLKL